MSVPNHKPVAAECLTCDTPILITKCVACASQFERYPHRHICNHCAFIFGMRPKDRTYRVAEYV